MKSDENSNGTEDDAQQGETSFGNNNGEKARAVVKSSSRREGGKKGSSSKKTVSEDVPTYDNDTKEKLSINDLTKMNMEDLREFAIGMGKNKEDLVTLKKQELTFNILKTHTERGGVIHAYGSLEILPDGYGFLRSPQNSYLPGSDDIYISPSQIRLFNLRTGDIVAGQIRPPKEGERFFAMLRVESVNFDEPETAQSRIPFDNLTPLYPDQRINMEMPSGDISTRMINLFCPIGK